MTSRTQPVAEVISIGDEMTSGARLDTNAQWLSLQLGELGVAVVQHTTIGDSLAINAAAFRAAAERADVVVATGGLGPTADDLTREALARVADVPLELDRASLHHIETLFAGRGRSMTERNVVQAMFPQGSRVIVNPQGTAPGIDLLLQRIDGKHARVFALPGVPAEMKQMWHATVRPRLIEQLGPHRRVLQQRVVKCFGVGESEMEQRLGQMIARDRSPQVGITVSQATISLRIIAEGASGAECQAMLDAAWREIHSLAGEYVFGEGEGYELQHAVADRLAVRGQSLTVVELGLGGLIAQWMADLERPALFRGSLGLADPPAAEQWLAAWSTNAPAAAEGPADSAAALALAARQMFQSDWALVVDRYPPLHADAADDAVPQMHPVRLRVAGPAAAAALKELSIGGHPEIIKPRIAKSGLHFLWQLLC